MKRLLHQHSSANIRHPTSDISSEVLEAAGAKESRAAFAYEPDLAALARDFADARDAHAREFARELRSVALRDGEEEFEVLAPVEREPKRLAAGDSRGLKQRV